MILSGHGKGNCDKLVIEFLSTLESETSWLDSRVLYKVEVERRTRVNGATRRTN